MRKHPRLLEIIAWPWLERLSRDEGRRVSLGDVPGNRWDAIAAGGSSLRDHVQPSGELGYFQHSFAVYDREGQACRHCESQAGSDALVRRMVQAGRSTFYCALHQR